MIDPKTFRFGVGKKAFALALMGPFFGLWAQVVDLDRSQNKATLVSGEKAYSLVLGAKNSKVLPLEDYLVIFDRQGQELVWISPRDVLDKQGQSGLKEPLALETAQIHLRGEFARGKVGDVAARDFQGVTTFVLSQKGPPGSVRVKSLSFARPEPGLWAPKVLSSSPDDPPSPDSPLSPIVMGLAGKEQIIWGSGPIAIVSEPGSGRPLLLSWDEGRRLLHEYRLSPEGRVDFKGSLELGRMGKGKKGKEKNPKVDIMGADISRSHHFEIISEGKKRTFSLTKLHIARSLKRVELVSAVVNETANSWTKGLLFWGLMDQAVDALDEAFGNEWVSSEDIVNDPQINLLSRKMSVKSVIHELRREKLLSEETIQELEDDEFLKSTRGKRWFVLSGVLLSFYGVNKFYKDFPRFEAAFKRFGVKIRSILTRSLEGLGLSADFVPKTPRGVERAQNRLKRWMLKNHYKEQLPIRDIKKVESSLIKICKKLKTPKARKVLEELKANRKIKSLKQRSKRLNELANSSLSDDIIDEFTERFVLDSSIQRFRQKLRQGAASLPEKSHWVKSAGAYFGRQLDKMMGASLSLSPAYRLQLIRGRLEVLEKHVEASNHLNRLKGEVILIDRMEAAKVKRVRDLPRPAPPRTKRDIEYLGISGRKAIIDRAVKAREKAKALGLSPKYTSITDRITKALEELSALDAQVAMLSTKGKVHPFFDFWAKSVVTPYTRYFLSEKKFYRSTRPEVKRVADWVKHNARRDYVQGPRGGMGEAITVSGENVRLGFTLGAADMFWDSFSQTLARADAVDPKERLWGNGPYHFDFMPGEKSFGPHFDLIGNALMGVPWWLLAMPVSFAKMNYRYGKSSSMSFGHRMKDDLKRAMNPVNLLYSYPQLWFIWRVSGRWIIHDYGKRAGDDVSPQVLSEIQHNLNDRLWSTRSIFEKRFYMSAIDNLAVFPQYFLREEVGSVLSKITGGPKAISFFNNFIAFSSGFFFHKWWADYFGTTNPDMIKILKRFDAESLLDKIDEKGLTNLKDWSLHEAMTMSSLITFFEMRKLEKEIPFPKEDISAMADWYGLLYARLLRGHTLPESIDRTGLEELLSRVKLRDIQDQDTGSDKGTPSFEYEEEAAEFLAMLDEMKSKTRQYSLEKSERKIFLMPTGESWEDLLQHNLEAALDDIAQVQGKLTQALRTIDENGRDFKGLGRAGVAVGVVDSLILADFLFSGVISDLSEKMLEKAGQMTVRTSGVLAKGLGRIRGGDGKTLKTLGQSLGQTQGRFGQLLKKWSKKVGLPVALASVPLYFWLGDQLDGHGRIQGLHTDLLEELQDILFQLTRTLVSTQLALIYDGRDLSQEGLASFKEYRDRLIDKEKMLRKVLKYTKDRNEVLQKERLYRAPQILAEYAPLGAGIGLSWMGGHWLLSKASKGFVPPRTDRFAPGILKLSLVFWFGFGHIADGIKKETLLTSNDFFRLHTAYRQTLFEKHLIDHILAEKRDSIDWEKDVLEKAMEDRILSETTFYRDRLLEILKSE
ncbi:MAG: hypothetical protein OXB88_07825 [Bacteriovoracales bacterium]|nr:hypothetical protein [Bacteriovoracales bacterium]